jgi:hypothetical protein
MSNCTFCKAEYIDVECQTGCFQSGLILGEGVYDVRGRYLERRGRMLLPRIYIGGLRWSLRNHSSFAQKTSSNMSPYPCLGPGIASAYYYYYTCCREDMNSDVSNITCFEY